MEEINKWPVLKIKWLPWEKGDKWEQWIQWPQWIQGIQWEMWPKWEPGKYGKDGLNWKDGKDWINGVDGIDGKDGSPDTPKQIKEKLESLEWNKRLDISAIKWIEKFQEKIEKKIEKKNVFWQYSEFKIDWTKIADWNSLNLITWNWVNLTWTSSSNGADITISSTWWVQSVVAWTNVSVDNTDPANPIVSSLTDRYKTTSTTSHTIVSTGTLTFTVDAGLSYTILQDISIVHNSSNYMSGHVVSYSWTSLVVDIQHKTGSGTYSSWTINLDWVPVEAVTGSGTTNEIAYFTGSQVIASLPTATYPSLTELSYLKGATSSIQTQITGKVSKTGDTMTGTLTNSQTTTASPVDWFVASTSSTATSWNQKASATVKWTASGWKSSWPTSARQVDFRAWILPEQAVSGEPSSIWKLQSQVNNGGWTDHFWIDSKVWWLGAYFNTNGSNWTPWTTRAITINNTGSYSWLDWTFSGTRKVSDGANSNGDRLFYASGGSYFSYIDGNSNSLFSYSYPTGLYHTWGGWFWGRVNAWQGSNPSSTLASQGSFASKAIRVTWNYTLTVNESVVYADASSAACSGTPTYNCSHWTNQTDCEKWDAHGGCSWFTGYSCSTYNNEYGMGTCSGTSWCTADQSSCSWAWDQTSCEAQDDSYGWNCTWVNNPWDCSTLPDETACLSTSGCSASYDYCSNYSDAGWDGTACATVSWYGCTYDSGSWTCSGDPWFWYTGCSGSYDNFSCTGDYYTGNCSGMYGASCNGTSTCSGIDDSTNCGFETGCTWSTSITLNLPQITTVPYRHYWVYNDSSSGADVIIQPYSGDQIDKTTSYTLANYKDSVHIQAFYESVSCGSFNEWACTPTGCSKVYSNCSWDWMSFTCSWNAVCDGIGDQSTCESTTYFSYCSGAYYSFKNWYLLSRS